MPPPIKEDPSLASSNSNANAGASTNANASNSASSKRHGARNQHKMKDFVKWLLATFPRECFAGAAADGHSHILDVAGGKGELAARLTLCHNVQVVMVDPRPADVATVYTKQVVPKLPNKWQNRLYLRLQDNPNFVQDKVQERFRQMVTYFTEQTVQSNPQLKQAIQDCTLLIGMHSDSATECIVDQALLHNKPFVVVPCCVFPNLFCQRYLLQKEDDERNNNTNPTKFPVRSWEQFCDYLVQKDERLKIHTLPFEGRNVAIYWDGALS